MTNNGKCEWESNFKKKIETETDKSTDKERKKERKNKYKSEKESASVSKLIVVYVKHIYPCSKVRILYWPIINFHQLRLYIFLAKICKIVFPEISLKFDRAGPLDQIQRTK